MNFAVSSTAFRKLPVEEVIATAAANTFALEFSSGLRFRPDMEKIYLNAKVARLPHNYFPAPEKPFVLNIASMNADVRTLSIQHCVRGLELAQKSGAPFYSAHAGFCVDPKPTDLGGKLPEEMLASREEFWRVFVENTKTICKRAEELEVQFLVENNVVSPSNVKADGSHALLCAETHESSRLIEEVTSPALGLLLDTGHLKVSSESLGFDPEIYIQKCHKKIFAIHHSDNNGKADTNHPLAPDYWFLKFMPLFKNAYHILEVHDQNPDEIRRQFHLLKEATA
jgi:sugar phosphate isomerase/epimerase